MTKSWKWLTTTFVVLLVAAGSVVAVAQTRDSETPEAVAGQDPSGVAAETVTTLDASLSDQLGVFRQARTINDKLPPTVATFIERSRPYGANPAMSRLALTTTGRSVYLVPANEQVCVAVIEETGTGLGCTLMEDIASNDGAPTSRTTDPATVVGVVPDGVQTVTVELESGKPIEVAVENNAYYADLGEGAKPRAVSFTAGDTAVRQEF